MDVDVTVNVYLPLIAGLTLLLSLASSNVPRSPRQNDLVSALQQVIYMGCVGCRRLSVLAAEASSPLNILGTKLSCHSVLRIHSPHSHLVHGVLSAYCLVPGAVRPVSHRTVTPYFQGPTSWETGALEAGEEDNSKDLLSVAWHPTTHVTCCPVRSLCNVGLLAG